MLSQFPTQTTSTTISHHDPQQKWIWSSQTPSTDFKRLEQPGFTRRMEMIEPNKKGKNGCKFSLTKTSQTSPVQSVHWTKGGPYEEFLMKYWFDEQSHPVDWLNVLLPLTNLDYFEYVDVQANKQTELAVAIWTSYTIHRPRLPILGSGVIHYCVDGLTSSLMILTYFLER